MNKKYFKIAPDKGVILVLGCFIIAACLLVLLGCRKAVSHPLPPVIMLAISMPAFCFALRSINLSEEGICIRYHVLFFKRKIAWARVQNVEFVHHKQQHYLLISFDNCPPYSEFSQSSIDSYMLRHPIRAIAIRVPSDKQTEYLGILKEFWPNMKFVGHSIDSMRP